MSFLNSIIKDSGNEYASIVSDGVGGSDVTGFVDTGSLIFNGLLNRRQQDHRTRGRVSHRQDLLRVGHLLRVPTTERRRSSSLLRLRGSGHFRYDPRTWHRSCTGSSVPHLDCRGVSASMHPDCGQGSGDAREGSQTNDHRP